jgi:hypothetical protein
MLLQIACSSAFVLLLCGCEALEAAKPDWDTLSCTSPSPIEGVQGLTDAALTEKFGVPSRDEMFALADRPDEFHVSLQNKYPLSKKSNGRVQIKEMTWTGPKCSLTIWLDKQQGSWRTFDSLIYSKEAEF